MGRVPSWRRRPGPRRPGLLGPADLAESVASFLAAGFDRDEPGVLVATPGHGSCSPSNSTRGAGSVRAQRRRASSSWPTPRRRLRRSTLAAGASTRSSATCSTAPRAAAPTGRCGCSARWSTCSHGGAGRTRQTSWSNLGTRSRRRGGSRSSAATASTSSTRHARTQLGTLPYICREHSHVLPGAPTIRASRALSTRPCAKCRAESGGDGHRARLARGHGERGAARAADPDVGDGEPAQAFGRKCRLCARTPRAARGLAWRGGAPPAPSPGEALLRAVNDQIAALGEGAGGWADPDHRFDFQCECGSIPGSCGGRVVMTMAEYDHVRAQSDRFALVRGTRTKSSSASSKPRAVCDRRQARRVRTVRHVSRPGGELLLIALFCLLPPHLSRRRRAEG